MDVKVDAIDHIVINVASVAKSAEWYQRVLGMEREEFSPENGKDKRTALKFGRQKINLRPIDNSRLLSANSEARSIWKPAI